MTVDISGQSVDVALAASIVGVPEAAIDKRFGVILIDPTLNRYVIKVNANAFEHRLHRTTKVSGPFSDLPISPLTA